MDKLVNECAWHFSNANNYYTLESEFARREKAIIRPIGEKLNTLGGLSLMRKVYTQVEEACMARYGKNCRSALDMKWNGIGDWIG